MGVSVADESANNPERIGRGVARALVHAAPSGWARVEVVFRVSSTICQSETTVFGADGRPLVMNPPDGWVEELKALRAQMYEPGRGTWFSLTVSVFSDTDPQFRYNFTDDPGWSPPVPSEVYAADQRLFPRDDKNIPAWLRSRLTDAGAPSQPVPPQPDPPQAVNGPIADRGPSVARPSGIGLRERAELVDEIAAMILAAAPADWLVISVEYLCLGRHVEVRVGVSGSAGQRVVWEPPREVDALFWRLRVGMYRERKGTWFTTFLRIHRPVRPRFHNPEIHYNYHNEPPWNPDDESFDQEQRMFPRDDSHMPDWFRRRLSDRV